MMTTSTSEIRSVTAEKISCDPLKTKILGAVGLAAKARAILVGTETVVEKMRSDKGNLLVAASDISENTKKRLVGTAAYHGIPYALPCVTKSDLAHAIGKKGDTAAVLLMKDGFVTILKRLDLEIIYPHTAIPQNTSLEDDINTTNTEVLH